MQSNRGRTVPERSLAALLWGEGLRYLTADGYRHRYGRRLLGQPDLIFTRKKIVIFVDGCFWHGCKRCHDIKKDCNLFWQEKISRNAERDRQVALTLRRQGWKVVRVWEHDLHGEKRLGRTTSRLLSLLCTSK
jgi:DNA mismatch endonuclease (patch repair protein)